MVACASSTTKTGRRRRSKSGARSSTPPSRRCPRWGSCWRSCPRSVSSRTSGLEPQTSNLRASRIRNERSSLRLVLRLRGDPFGVFLRHERLDPCREQRSWTGAVAVRRGVGEEDELFVLQRFTRRTILDPVLLILIQLKKSFENRDRDAKAGCHPSHFTHVDRCQHGNHRCGENLHDLDRFIGPLARLALAVVPSDLILQPLHH